MNDRKLHPNPSTPSLRRIASAKEALEVSEDRRVEYEILCSRLVVCEAMARAQRTTLLMSVQFSGPASTWIRVIPWTVLGVDPVRIGVRNRLGAQSREFARQLAELRAPRHSSEPLRALLVDCRELRALDGARMVEALLARDGAEREAGADLLGAIVILCAEPGQRLPELRELESRLASSIVLRDPCFADALRRLDGARGPIERLRVLMRGMGLRLDCEPAAIEALAEQVWNHPLGVVNAEACAHELGLRVFHALEATPGNVVRVYRDGPLVGISIHTEEAKS